jgi:hypothetical protein
MRRLPLLTVFVLLGCHQATAPTAAQPGAAGRWVGGTITLTLSETRDQPNYGTLAGSGTIGTRAVTVTGWRDCDGVDVRTGREIITGTMIGDTWTADIGADSLGWRPVTLTRQH